MKEYIGRLVMFACGLCAFVAAGFPLNPSFTPEAVKGYKAKADAGDAEAQYLYSYALANGVGSTSASSSKPETAASTGSR